MPPLWKNVTMAVDSEPMTLEMIFMFFFEVFSRRWTVFLKKNMSQVIQFVTCFIPQFKVTSNHWKGQGHQFLTNQPTNQPTTPDHHSPYDLEDGLPGSKDGSVVRIRINP